MTYRITIVDTACCVIEYRKYFWHKWRFMTDEYFSNTYEAINWLADNISADHIKLIVIDQTKDK